MYAQKILNLKSFQYIFKTKNTKTIKYNIQQFVN